MLASILPGLRDLRVPLASGFLWLVVVWLLAHQWIPTKDEADGLAAEVYTVFGAFGSAALIAVTSFVAYIVGILIARPTSWIVVTFAELITPRSSTIGPSLLAGRTPRFISRATEAEALQLAERMSDEMISAGLGAGSASSADIYEELFSNDERRLGTTQSRSASVAQIYEAMRREIPLVATRLLANNRELFDRYDRADAEASFRFAIAIPIFAIACIGSITLGLPWWGICISTLAGLAVAGLIAADGSRKRREANDAIFQAVFVNEVQFPAIDAIREQIEVVQGVQGES